MKKDWYKSKTMWGAVFVFIGGGFSAVGLSEVGGALVTIGVSLGFVGLRHAVG